MCVCVCVCVCVYVCTRVHVYTNIFLIHSSVDRHLGCFHILAIINNAVVKINVHISFPMSVFVFFRTIPRNRVT